ncbi:MAG: hypothetical protein IJO47_07125 [Clostridia bacterium]|nr:hypothetical protein [Clostridia bacterium]
MKASIITRIVLYSVLILVLCGVLVSGIMGSGFGLGMGLDYDDKSYISADGEITVDGNTIDRIEIEWISGDINISGQTKNFDITFSADEAEKDWQNMQYRIKNGVLSIKFCKSRMMFGNVPDKELNITLPVNKTFKEIDIESVSSDIIDVDRWVVRADAVKVENVSGKTDLVLGADYIDCESVSGDVNIEAANYLKDGSFETVSADIELGFYKVYGVEDFGFAAEFDSVSGNIKCEYDNTFFDDTLVHGTPTCELDFDTVSGNVKIFRQTNHRGY